MLYEKISDYIKKCFARLRGGGCSGFV